MKIELVRSECNNGRTCPGVNRTDQGTYVVQGYLTDDVTTVEVPLSLLPELASSARLDGIQLTDQATVLITGAPVIDREALAELNLPTGENAVEVASARLPLKAGTPC